MESSSIIVILYVTNKTKKEWSCHNILLNIQILNLFLKCEASVRTSWNSASLTQNSLLNLCRTFAFKIPSEVSFYSYILNQIITYVYFLPCSPQNAPQRFMVESRLWKHQVNLWSRATCLGMEAFCDPEHLETIWYENDGGAETVRCWQTSNRRMIEPKESCIKSLLSIFFESLVKFVTHLLTTGDHTLHSRLTYDRYFKLPTVSFCIYLKGIH